MMVHVVVPSPARMYFESRTKAVRGASPYDDVGSDQEAVLDIEVPFSWPMTRMALSAA